MNWSSYPRFPMKHEYWALKVQISRHIRQKSGKISMLDITFFASNAMNISIHKDITYNIHKCFFYIFVMFLEDNSSFLFGDNSTYLKNKIYFHKWSVNLNKNSTYIPLHHPHTKVRTSIVKNKINKLVYLFRESQIITL